MFFYAFPVLRSLGEEEFFFRLETKYPNAEPEAISAIAVGPVSPIGARRMIG